MPHYYVRPQDITEADFVIRGDEAHHLSHVLRCGLGDELRLFDGTGSSYRARIDAVSRSEIRGSILSKEDIPAARSRVHLFCAVPKGDRFDWLIEKAVELGVHSVTPLITERSTIVDIGEAKLQRWRRVAQAAAGQSLRADVMVLGAPRRLSDVVQELPSASLHLIPWEGEGARSMAGIAKERTLEGDVSIFIGPEGGFTLREIEEAQRQGVIPVTLGRRILRVETAGLLSVILVLDLAGEYGA